MNLDWPKERTVKFKGDLTLDDFGWSWVHTQRVFSFKHSHSVTSWCSIPSPRQCFTYVVVGPRGSLPLASISALTPLMFNIDPENRPSGLPWPGPKGSRIVKKPSFFRVELLKLWGSTSQKPMNQRPFLSSPNRESQSTFCSWKSRRPKKPRDVAIRPTRRAARRVFFLFRTDCTSTRKRQQQCKAANKESCIVRSASCFACFERGLIV